MPQRLDKWLVYARFCRHRTVAQELISGGSVRLNRNRVSKTSQTVNLHDVLTLAIAGRVRVVRVLGTAERRGPAQDAIQLYETLDSLEKAGASDSGVV